jgi:alkane 1-monooxygenase
MRTGGGTSVASGWHFGFVLVCLLPLIPVACGWLAARSDHPMLWAAMPLVLASLTVGIVQGICRAAVQVDTSLAGRPGWRTFHRLLLLPSVPLQLFMLWAGAEYWASDVFETWGRLLYFLSVSMFSSAFAINVGHELIHRATAFDRAVGGVLLSTVCFGSFKLVHTRIHHRHVGTPLDFATAPRGMSIYRFLCRAYPLNFIGAWRLERSRLEKIGRPWWRSELWVWYGLSILWLGVAWWRWGAAGASFFLGQSAIAIGQLEWINYIQHYGLKRRRTASGGYEPVGPRHSWNQALFIHDWALLNLFRHADHHVHPGKPYPLLEDLTDAPRYPYQHVVMMTLSLVPPLFRRVVHPCLDRIENADGVAHAQQP